MEDSATANCNSTLSKPQFLAVNLVWCTVSLLSLVMCVVATFLSVYRFCCKTNTVSTERTEKLLLYLVIFSMLYAFVNCFQWFWLLIQYVNPETAVGCAIVSFGIEYLGTGILVITFCIGIHLLLLVCRPKCLNGIIEDKKKERYKKIELGYIFSAIFVPVLFVPWPWIHNRYGDAGNWCWIKAWDEDCNKLIDGFIQQIVLWYLWVFLLMAFTTVVTATTLCLLCYYKKTKVELDSKDGKICALLFYLVVYLAVNVIGLTNRAILWDQGKSPYPLLILHAMAYPLWGSLSAIVVYLVVYYNWKRANQRQKFKSLLHKEAKTVRASVCEDVGTDFATNYVIPEESDINSNILDSFT